MKRISSDLKLRIRTIRSSGYTYSEINSALHLKLAKSTLSYICKNVPLPPEYQQKIENLNITGLNKARLIALAVNRVKREHLLESIKHNNGLIVGEIDMIHTAKIALAMLCLGEASKYKSTGTFSLGSSDPRIIVLFLGLLKQCYEYHIEKVRCTVQCRADQDVNKLEEYWMNITGIDRKQFYKSRIDPRTIGKPTKNLSYHGVLKIDYFDIRIQLELESLSDLIYNRIDNRARSTPVV